MVRLAERLLRRSSDAFARTARAHGVRSRAVRALEPAARELFPDQPENVLASRELFEQAAKHAVVGIAGNLDLSFGLVDVLAGAVEALGLARASDVPDPFRRVWIRNDAGVRRRGVVLRCEGGEVAVFCPPGRDPFSATSDVVKMSYRGFSSAVEYDLKLNDAVRLPGALVLHLTRPESGGAIGRATRRVEVRIPARIQAAGAFGTRATCAPCCPRGRTPPRPSSSTPPSPPGRSPSRSFRRRPRHRGPRLPTRIHRSRSLPRPPGSCSSGPCCAWIPSPWRPLRPRDPSQRSSWRSFSSNRIPMSASRSRIPRGAPSPSPWSSLRPPILSSRTPASGGASGFPPASRSGRALRHRRLTTLGTTKRSPFGSGRPSQP